MCDVLMSDTTLLCTTLYGIRILLSLATALSYIYISIIICKYVFIISIEIICVIEGTLDKICEILYLYIYIN